MVWDQPLANRRPAWGDMGARSVSNNRVLASTGKGGIVHGRGVMHCWRVGVLRRGRGMRGPRQHGWRLSRHGAGGRVQGAKPFKGFPRWGEGGDRQRTCPPPRMDNRSELGAHAPPSSFRVVVRTVFACGNFKIRCRHNGRARSMASGE